jgi:hypothetical protein
VYLKDNASPAAAPAAAKKRRRPSSYAQTAKPSASATPIRAPTSVTATREYATGRNANASSAAATNPSRTPQSRRAAQYVAATPAMHSTAASARAAIHISVGFLSNWSVTFPNGRSNRNPSGPYITRNSA